MSSTDPALSFDAVRQFVVVPDRYYRVEFYGNCLYFLKTGSQFDINHPGSMNRGKMQAVPVQPAIPSELAKRATPRLLIWSGVGVVLGSFALLYFLSSNGWVVPGLVFLLGFGFVLLVAGFVTPSKPYAEERADPKNALNSHKHNFTVPLLEIQQGVLMLPKRAGQAAYLQFQLISGKSIKLTIKTENDLLVVQSSLLPLLGHKVQVA